MPLLSLSSDPNEQYFSDGTTSELIAGLAKFSGLQVTSHTSVKRCRDTKQPLPEIARELGVDAVIEGTVMRSEISGRKKILRGASPLATIASLGVVANALTTCEPSLGRRGLALIGDRTGKSY